MFFSLLLYSFYTFVIGFRGALGRESFPCFLWWGAFTSGPIIGLVSVCRCWRLLFLFLQNQSKTTDNTRKTKVYRALSSHWAVCCIFVFFIVIHIILSGTAIGVITPNVGCFTTGWSANLLLAEILVMGAVYVLLFFGLLVFTCVNKIRDTYGITKEIIYMPMYWVPILIIFAIAFLGVDLRFWPERNVQANIFLVCNVKIIVRFLQCLLMLRLLYYYLFYDLSNKSSKPQTRTKKNVLKKFWKEHPLEKYF